MSRFGGSDMTIQVIWTVIAFVVFVGIVGWAYSSKQKKRFEEAARLPLEDDEDSEHLPLNRENKNG
ncbi:MAG: cbb3-type cytochrome c oxidase subunit 3 [Proteobacteria bacterium]|nr:MAG: cbb3-type cytochrome c oxidase subunit 3 [Pseudomonadota bacterium]